MRFTARVRVFTNVFKRKYNIARDASLTQTCSFIRKATRSSLRVRKGASRPGSPPHAHTRAGLREINYDVKGNEGIIGPRRFSGSNFFNRPVPNIHEIGGVAIRRRAFAMHRYPERSFMYSTTKRLAKTGRISSRFRVSFQRVF